MYEVTEYEKEGLKFFRLSGENAFAEICPERGAIVTAFYTQGKNILYLNEETLFDRTKNVRGGIPVLFPMGGQLSNGEYEWKSNRYSMANHGLARNRAWSLTDSNAADGYAELKVTLASDSNTKRSFPFDFEVELAYRLENGKLTIRQIYRNFSADAMPIYPGFHPYFNISNKIVSLKTDASQYLDYNDQQIKPFNGTLDMNDLVEPVVLRDSSEKVEADFDQSHVLVVEKDQAFRYIVLWTEKGKDYVCVEPWTAKKDEYNKKQELLYVEKGKPLQLEVAFYLK